MEDGMEGVGWGMGGLLGYFGVLLYIGCFFNSGVGLIEYLGGIGCSGGRKRVGCFGGGKRVGCIGRVLWVF